MFYDNPNLIKVADKVWVYKNFVPQEKVKEINDIMSDAIPSLFRVEEHNIEWYRDKTSPLIPELIDVWNSASELIGPEYLIHPNLALQIIRPGDDGMFIHVDSPGEGMEEELIQDDRWSTCCIISFGLVIYFGEFEGGEVFYPNLGVEVAPQPGDLVIHGAHYGHEHGVKEVTSGVRYAYSNFMLAREKNPGTFPAYGTPEDEERKAKGLVEHWNEPIKTAPHTH